MLLYSNSLYKKLEIASIIQHTATKIHFFRPMKTNESYPLFNLSEVQFSLLGELICIAYECSQYMSYPFEGNFQGSSRPMRTCFDFFRMSFPQDQNSICNLASGDIYLIVTSKYPVFFVSFFCYSTVENTYPYFESNRRFSRHILGEMALYTRLLAAITFWKVDNISEE